MGDIDKFFFSKGNIITWEITKGFDGLITMVDSVRVHINFLRSCNALVPEVRTSGWCGQFSKLLDLKCCFAASECLGEMGFFLANLLEKSKCP